MLIERFDFSGNINITVKHIESHVASTCWFFCIKILQILLPSQRELFYI